MGTQPLSRKRGRSPLLNFRPMSIVAKRLDGSRWYLAWGRPQPRRLCVRWGSRPLRKRRRNPPPQFSAHFYCGQMALCIKMPLGMAVGLSPGDFVLDRDPPLPPNFSAHVCYSYCDFVTILHNAQSLLVRSSSSSSFSILCVLFLEKSLIVLSLFRYAQLHHIAPTAEVGVAN